MGIIKIETSINNNKQNKMNRAQNRMHIMIERFKENLNGVEIGKYFQVPMKIEVETEDVLNITCTIKINNCDFFVKLELPFEVNCIILSYLYQPSFAKYQIIVPNDYPFKPPFWILINSNEEKYKKAEMYQNSRYRYSWEPSISFEKDILYMIECMYIFKNN